MLSLERRVAELEKMESSVDMVFFIVSVEVGKLNEELNYLSDHKGQEWARAPEENEEEFKRRARDEVTRNSLGCALLFSFSQDDVHATK